MVQDLEALYTTRSTSDLHWGHHINILTTRPTRLTRTPRCLPRRRRALGDLMKRFKDNHHDDCHPKSNP
ncbi:hypothetical protein PAXRUDRAFT_831586 [Paxillus rubicundulus Ve08.2h10]|uniref:Uncharacterized protein n=1 Tax=Paxillus rubicundulus Ve08.2h10 TaxID=930991 RepID=A0A0D0E1Q9_9AGAM|nr:hypothetical protein PAXRUDRAFT_831586 [Paxillus rubicundulus Ve08.2h10]